MKRIYVRIFMALAVSSLAGCSPQYEDAAVMEEPVVVEPIAKELDDGCNRTASGAIDGIGGTGCKVD